MLWYFDKLTLQAYELGEIQANFNMSFVIDGTKDTTKMIVDSYTLADEVEPNTIIYHLETRTWWIVASDKVEKYINDNEWFYVHELTLEGAIELLNARDLTDCGFNQNRYTIETFIRRLFTLSTFEIPLGSISTDLELNKNVDYVKTYENYTLLSAIRDFLDGYNQSAKLTFTMSGANVITSCNLIIISKTGSKNFPLIDIECFNDIKEIKNVNKNSFGTVVVSNAENVISTKEKTYPLVGSAKLSGDSFVITRQNAILRLPSPVYKANWVKIFFKIRIEYVVPGSSTIYASVEPRNEYDFNKFIEKVKNDLHIYSPTYEEDLVNQLNDNLEYIKNNIYNAGTITVYEGNGVDPTYNNGSGKVIKGKNVPYLAEAYEGLIGIPTDTVQLVLMDKDNRENLPKPAGGIYWERGSNIIRGFEFLNKYTMINNFLSTDLQASSFSWLVHPASNPSADFEIRVYFGDNNGEVLKFQDISVACNYIPMTDLKIKLDNQRDKKDIQLYNQNGKLTDSRALSKLLNSYSKEISSNSITKYICSYDYLSMPNVGQRVFIGDSVDNIYVINNVSLDFYVNENNEYYVEGEYTLSKQFAVKSIMVNPNTNIRDYQIPQNYNVKRKQLYRDYYEFSYEIDPYADQDFLLDIREALYFDRVPQEQGNFASIIKIVFNDLVGGDSTATPPTSGSNTWYYQLDTTKYELDKMFYVVLDFNDNNIIGYGSQNVYSGFDISRVFTNWIDTVNTPISYVDDLGEAKEFHIKFLTNDKITKIYDDYKVAEGYSAEDKSLYNFSCFIPGDIYTMATEPDLQIDEPNYNKDAIEVPVFEYCCQIGDSAEICIGDNILAQESDSKYIYLYGYRFYDNKTALIDNVAPENTPYYVAMFQRWVVSNSAKLSLDLYMGQRLKIELFGASSYYDSDDSFVDSTPQKIQANKDLAIFRFVLNRETLQVEKTQTMFVISSIPQNFDNADFMELYINHYKLK